ncbi:hypothetical protein [Polaromonas sp.]|uniref:hypothetical protein n=1 Tax=Polaromonas sp. TaxID=1869339 RepID=UPI00352AD7F9
MNNIERRIAALEAHAVDTSLKVVALEGAESEQEAVARLGLAGLRAVFLSALDVRI